MARKKTTDKRCAVCGKVVVLNEKVYRIVVSKNAEAGWVDHTLWGIAHPTCFTSALGLPEMVLSELKKLAHG